MPTTTPSTAVDGSPCPMRRRVPWCRAEAPPPACRGACPAGDDIARPLASVIVAVHGNVRALVGLLRSLAGQDCAGGLQVIVVDNHRSPRVPVALFHEFTATTGIVGMTGTVVHEPRAGLSRARNAGVRHARGVYLLFTDPDARPEHGWVAGLVAALRNTGAYCVGGRVEPAYLGDDEHPGLEPGVGQFFVPGAWPAHTCALRAPFWLAGCNLGTRCYPPPVFAEDLGARPRRHLSCEDLELTTRIQRAGLGVVVAPEAVVHRAIHRRDLRLPALLGRAFWHGVSIARMRQRHPEATIYDTARMRDVLRDVDRASWRSTAMHLARVVGWRLESVRLTSPDVGVSR